MLGFLYIILRTITAFILLLIFIHILGKQIIAQKTYHLYIASITIGTIAGNLAFNLNINYLYFILSFIIMGTIVFTLNILGLKNRRYRKWIAGKPTVLIEKGQILEESMNRIGYTLDSLKQALRENEIFNIDEVECAILEVNGSMSVLKKPEYQPITKRDLNIVSSTNRLPIELIIDGEILFENLSKYNYDPEWLRAELKKKNVDVSEISYAVLGTKGNLYIDLFRDQLS